MDRIRIAEDTPTKIVLEKSLAGSDIWRGWSRSLIMPLLFVAGSSIALFTWRIQTWWLWVIFVGALIVEAVTLYMLLVSERKITVTIDLHSGVATRVEKLVSGIEKKHALALDQVSRILIHSEELGHQTKLWFDSHNHPRLEIANNYDLLSLEQGRYIYKPPIEEVSEIKSLDVLASKVGRFLQKPVASRSTDQGNIISDDRL